MILGRGWDAVGTGHFVFEVLKVLGDVVFGD